MQKITTKNLCCGMHSQSFLTPLDGLREDNDIVIMEGADHRPRLTSNNMMSQICFSQGKVSAPVIIVADIERGGCFASIVGTMLLLEPDDRELVRGFVIK